MRRNMARCGLAIAVLFCALMALLVHWQVFAAAALRNHPRNVRPLLAAARRHRGAIVDRRGRTLAVSRLQDGVWVRDYPTGAVSAPVTGYCSLRYGLSGMERAANARLAAPASPRSFREWREFWSRRPLRGSDVRLSLDLALQRAAAGALGDRRGAVVVLDTRTGEALALVSSPSYDPTDIDAHWRRLRDDASAPLLNRATQGLYPPGSTFKLVTALTAVEANLLPDSFRFQCTGKRSFGEFGVECPHAHGELNATRAMTVSCNGAFATLAVRAGWSRLTTMTTRLGFGAPLLGDIPCAAASLHRAGSAESPRLLAQTGFGQGQLAVTPLQMAVIAATIANVGRLAPPRLTPLDDDAAGESIQIVAPGTAERVRAMMLATVKHGSTHRVFSQLGLQVAGKTGTAENPHGRPHAWFVAATDRLAIAVIVENAGAGSRVAAPVAAAILREWLHGSR